MSGRLDRKDSKEVGKPWHKSAVKRLLVQHHHGERTCMTYPTATVAPMPNKALFLTFALRSSTSVLAFFDLGSSSFSGLPSSTSFSSLPTEMSPALRLLFLLEDSLEG